MPSKGNPELRLRLPASHWVMQIRDPAARRREVERALKFYAAYKDQDIERAMEFYFAYKDRMDELREWLDEIRQALLEDNLAISSSGENKEDFEGDPRLFANMSKFLDF